MTPPDGPVSGLTFDNSFTRELPADPLDVVRPRQVRGACYSRVRPQPAPRPVLLASAREVVELIGLPAEASAHPEFVEVFAGNRVVPGMDPFAMCYGGHQFGHWAGQLGDGRAINLGEVLAPAGRFLLQLKGAGPTPYARHADGWAVLRSSVREFLCSEAMHHLGVPTTRALSLIASGANVTRDMFYDGRPAPEPGAVVCRVAPAFTRFGNFEIFASRGELVELNRLIDYTLATSFPHLAAPGVENRLRWFEEVATTTARMIVHWLRVGFVHGVMNTDNMSILGVTIDYGPYGWLEDFDPDWTPNTTDAGGKRYRYGNQAPIGWWNLARLAESLSTVIPDHDGLTAALSAYGREFESGWRAMIAAKLGLSAYDPALDEELVAELEAMLKSVETDMPIFYRQLARVPLTGSFDMTTVPEALKDAYYRPEQVTEDYGRRLNAWLARYAARVRADGIADPERAQRMDRVNPKYVLRNWLAQEAIDRAESGDAALVNEQLEVLRRPYEEQPGKDHFAGKRPEWARHRAGCSMLSCSS